jgi:hypothetical protein
MKRVKLRGRLWGIGVDWQPSARDLSVAGAIANVKATAEADEKKKKAFKSVDDVQHEIPDMAVVRGAQIGFVFSGGKIDKFRNSNSLAAHLTLPYRRFLGSFRFDDENGNPVWWVFARSEGDNIGGYSDTCYNRMEDAEAAVSSLLNLISSKDLFEVVLLDDPEKSSEFIADHLHFNPLRNIFSREGKILPFPAFQKRGGNLLKTVIAAGMCCLGGYFLVDFGIDYWNEMSFSAAAQEKQRQLEARRKYIAEHPEAIFAEGWKKSPRAGIVLEKCGNAINNSRIAVSGWILDEAKCEANQTAKVSRVYNLTRGATYLHLPAHFRFDVKDQKVLLESREIDADLGHGDMTLSHRNLMEAGTARAIFLQFAQALGTKTKISFLKPATKSEADVGTFTCPWSVGLWEIEGLPPNLLFGGIGEILDSLPSLTVETVTYNATQHNWKLSGKVYVR